MSGRLVSPLKNLLLRIQPIFHRASVTAPALDVEFIGPHGNAFSQIIELLLTRERFARTGSTKPVFQWTLWAVLRSLV